MKLKMQYYCSTTIKVQQWINDNNLQPEQIVGIYNNGHNTNREPLHIVWYWKLDKVN